MIRLPEVGGLYQTMPGNLKDPQTKAFMYACDRQIKKLLECAEKIKVWCALETVDEKFLDYMAAEYRTPFYKSSLNAYSKRELIINTQHWYMKLGTAKAINEMLLVVFSGSVTTVEEWFNYGGKPWHFRVKVGVGELPIEFGELALFRKMLNEIKRGAAYLDYLEANVSTVAAVPVKIQTQLQLLSTCYPRYNLPYLCYDGTAKYNNTYHYQRYKSKNAVDLYPTALSIHGTVNLHTLLGNTVLLKLHGDAGTLQAISRISKIAYQTNVKPANRTNEIQIAVHTHTAVKLPKYEIQLIIRYHVTKYDGTYKYDGSRKYDSEIMVDTL